MVVVMAASKVAKLAAVKAASKVEKLAVSMVVESVVESVAELVEMRACFCSRNSINSKIRLWGHQINKIGRLDAQSVPTTLLIKLTIIARLFAY